MKPDTPTPDPVVESYKKHKLAISALRHMRKLVNGFEQERLFDTRMAWIGVVLILLVLGTAAWFFVSADSVTLSRAIR